MSQPPEFDASTLASLNEKKIKKGHFI